MTMKLDTMAVSRRGFLKIGAASGGGLLLSLALPGAVGDSFAEGAETFAPNAFIRIDRQGKVTFTIAQVEMGQGDLHLDPGVDCRRTGGTARSGGDRTRAGG